MVIITPENLALSETFVSGGVFTLFLCSIPRVRNHGNHHTRESLKGFFCAHQTFSLSLSLSLSQALANAIVSFKGFVVYIISV